MNAFNIFIRLGIEFKSGRVSGSMLDILGSEFKWSLVELRLFNRQIRAQPRFDWGGIFQPKLH